MDNKNDMIRKERDNYVSGEKCGMSKLTTWEVIKIRSLYLSKKYSHSILAHSFNVSKTTITNILNNKTWKNL